MEDREAKLREEVDQHFKKQGHEPNRREWLEAMAQAEVAQEAERQNRMRDLYST